MNINVFHEISTNLNVIDDQAIKTRMFVPTFEANSNDRFHILLLHVIMLFKIILLYTANYTHYWLQCSSHAHTTNPRIPVLLRRSSDTTVLTDLYYHYR